MAAVWSALPSPSGSAGVPENSTLAARPPSKVRYPVRVRPSALPRTTNSRVPPEPPSFEVAALTTSTSARAPPSTGSLTPVSVQAPPSWLARTPLAVVDHRVPASACANAGISEPSASPPISSSRCAAVPSARTSPPARTTASTRGSGASTRPISSATIATSTGPAPMPPDSSGKGSPSRPISARRAQVFSSNPGSAPVTRRRCSLSPYARASIPLTASRRAFCSSSKVKSTVRSQPQDRAGDDGALNLVRAAVDGDLAVVQVLGRGGPRPLGHVGAAVGVGGQRERAGQVHEQFGGGLLQLRAPELEHRRRRVRPATGGVGDHAQRGQLEGEQLVLQL